MKRYVFFIIVLVSVALAVTSGNANELISENEALRKIFRDAASFDHRHIILTDSQQAKLSKDAGISFGQTHQPQFDVYTAKTNGKIVGYALVDTVIGKWGPIHYMAGLSSDGKIKKIIVLEYLEIRGQPIAKNRFLKQYQKKGKKNHIRLHKDINGISGATISSRAITDGIRKLVYALDVVKSGAP